MCWVRKYHAQGATMDGSAVDEQNREVFEEVLEVMIKAWTQDSFTHRGKYYQVPSTPEGVDWPCREVTESYGAPGEIDPVTGKSVEISVTPAPLQDPHPRFWQGYAASESTVLRCAARGNHNRSSWCPSQNSSWNSAPSTNTLPPRTAGSWPWAKASASPGGWCSAIRSKKRNELGVKTVGYVFGEYLARFGFVEIVRRPDDNPAFPLNLGGSAATVRSSVGRRAGDLVAPPDDVKRKIEDVAKCHGDGKPRILQLAAADPGQSRRSRSPASTGTVWKAHHSRVRLTTPGRAFPSCT